MYYSSVEHAHTAAYCNHCWAALGNTLTIHRRNQGDPKAENTPFQSTLEQLEDLIP